MIPFTDALYYKLESQLNNLSTRELSHLDHTEQAINIVIDTMQKLKSYCINHTFENKTAEINFFRHIKPRFASKLIYYNELYSIELAKPIAGTKSLQKYYKAELSKLKDFFHENAEFYRYYRTGCQLLDKQYFIRGKGHLKLSLDSFCLQADERFSTSHDYKVAKIIANDLLKDYIHSQLSTLNTSSNNVVTSKNGLTWTASKVALTELIYALHADGAFNEGKCELKEITSFFESVFNLQLGQYHKTFLEIRERKADRTKFLTQLRDKLVNRMDTVDDYPK